VNLESANQSFGPSTFANISREFAARKAKPRDFDRGAFLNGFELLQAAGRIGPSPEYRSRPSGARPKALAAESIVDKLARPRQARRLEISIDHVPPQNQRSWA